ncbi:MAG TPA: hypothetical protein PLR24_00805 [Saprospiraceae bacterium]|nr:hypothetical protein [Saprospiraceae bacterium]
MDDDGSDRGKVQISLAEGLWTLTFLIEGGVHFDECCKKQLPGRM